MEILAKILYLIGISLCICLAGALLVTGMLPADFAIIYLIVTFTIIMACNVIDNYSSYYFYNIFILSLILLIIVGRVAEWQTLGT